MTDRARRTHPASLITATVKSARNLAAGGIGLLLLVLRGQWGAAAVAGLIVLAILSILPWLRWWRFTYRVGADELVIDQGILNRRRRSVPFERIQDISFEQGVVARLFGTVTVRIETAGGKADDVVLDSVKRAEGARLREMLVPGRLPDAHRRQAGEAVFAMDLKRVLLSGLLSFSLLIWTVAVFDVLRRIANWYDLDTNAVIGMAEHDVAPRLGFALIGGIVALVIVAGLGVGVVRALLRDYGFRLTHAEGRFRCVRGLAPRREIVIVDRRIQLALIRRNWLGRVFGWCTVDFQTLGGSEGPSGRQEVAPLARAEEAARVIATAGLPRFAEEVLDPVDRGHGTRLAIRRCVPLVVIAGALSWFEPLALWLLVLVVPLFVLAELSPRFHRLAFVDGALHLAQGVIGRRAWIVPVAAVQSVTLRRGPIQRMLGLVTVAPDTAGAHGHHRPTVEDLWLDDGKALAAGLLARP